MARRFGLGSRIDVGLENEKAGLIPDKEWKLRRFGEPWQQGESVISGIGQGYILTTPLQLATMVARIANGGYEVKPTFTKVKDKSTIRKIDVADENIKLVKDGMFAVVNIPGSTAYRSHFDYNGQMMSGKNRFDPGAPDYDERAADTGAETKRASLEIQGSRFVYCLCAA